MLIVARVVQGVGAALLTPQTLSTITRIFPADRRGVALSVWGATAGVATLVGPLAGGVLVDRLGWSWIFFVNVPIGVIGLALAVFVGWQARNRGEPLIPLRRLNDRNFSLANVGVAAIAVAVTAMILPLMFYAQGVCGLTSTRAALPTAPMAVATGMLAPIVGRIVDRSHPRPIIGFGFLLLAIALTWLLIEMTTTTPIWRLLLPLGAMGAGMAFLWSPLGATATRNLPVRLAGAGSGVYNPTRQVGSVLGSAGMAALMSARITAELPARPGDAGPVGVSHLPSPLREPFSRIAPPG
jgi:MFS family permease